MFRRRRESSEYAPLTILRWAEMRFIIGDPYAPGNFSHYLLEQIHRGGRKSQEAAVKAIPELFHELWPVLQQRTAHQQNRDSAAKALMQGWQLGQEDIRFRSARRGMINRSDHNALCMLRQGFPENDSLAVSKAMDASYYLARTGIDHKVLGL